MVGRKRKSAPATVEAPESLSTPPSKRGRPQRAAAASSTKTSKYFDPSPEDSESDVITKPTKTAATPKKRRGRPPKKAKQLEPESEDADEFKDDDPEEESSEAKQEDTTTSDNDEEAPPKIIFIPLPQLRDTAGIPYQPHTLHPNTLLFLADLKRNNKRSWLKLNDKEYRRALSDWESYVSSLTEKITDIDPTIPELPFKDVNFRIYRDIRFTNDPTPYKPHFSAAFSRTGRKGPYACYYIHVEPNGGSFIGGGLWHPDGPALAKLRASIDERPRRWRRVLTEEGFGRTFLGGGEKKRKKGKKKTGKEEEEEALSAYAESNKGNALKTRPKGFHPEHRDMQLLKLRNHTVWKKVDDDVFTREGGLEEVMDVVGSMVGFVTHLNKIVMPDPDDDDEESEEE
ncbi:hypothetical protein QBC40DRAFT_278066 [Triangularia verruculosa]|uniref:Uncharacterized protein n=1 Tax=Triangularia verruculosa TaxID=2587418 RepID=A0AAN6XPJ3_9PEZI|nr:hypothetical protein QBC40DRAFT_278066 [Triangularia verruculosa]